MFSQPSQILFFPIYTQEGVVYQPFMGPFGYLNQFNAYDLIGEPSKSTQIMVKSEEEPTKWSPNISLAEISQAQKLEPQNLNIKNIIPNLSRKLVRFLCSSECKRLICKICPDLEKKEYNKILAFISGIKGKYSKVYMGKKDLLRIWFKDPKNQRTEQFYEILRRVSYHYLQNICPNSILLSKRIKPSLKRIHLQYRRKLISMMLENSLQ